MSTPPALRASPVALGALTACLIQTACVVHLNGVGTDGIASHTVTTPIPALVSISVAVLGIGLCVTVPALRRPRWSAPITLACLMILVGALLRVAPVKAVLILERASFHATALLSGLTWVAVLLEASDSATSDAAPPPWMRGRWALLGLPALGAAGLLALHVGTTVDPVLADRVPAAVLATISALSLLVFPIGSLTAWRRPSTRRVGIAGAAVTLCVVTRGVYTSDPGLLGGAADTTAAPMIGASLVLASLVSHVALRPRMETWVRGLISVLSILAVSLGWLAYSQAYGSYEDVLGDVIASFTGFRLPYPAYVPHWRATAAMVGAFLALSCVYSNLVAQGTRRRGLALALLCAAGLGFASPHLLLAFTAGGALLLTARASQLDAPSSTLDAAQPVTASFDPSVLEDVAERLELGPVVFADALTVATGRVEGIRVELRHRASPRAWQLTLEAGLPGKGKPELRIVPRKSQTDDVAGHLMFRTHRCDGDARGLEGHTSLLDAMTRFPRAHIERWPSGCRASMVAGDPGLDVDGIEALVRAMVSLERS